MYRFRIHFLSVQTHGSSGFKQGASSDIEHEWANFCSMRTKLVFIVVYTPHCMKELKFI